MFQRRQVQQSAAKLRGKATATLEVWRRKDCHSSAEPASQGYPIENFGPQHASRNIGLLSD